VSPSVAALAGRRVDPPDARRPRFPANNVPRVKQSLQRIFRHHNVTLLVCSAACGADLIALEVARQSRIPFKVVLPFSPDRFRETSVVDRPGPWGEIYDRVLADINNTSNLLVLKRPTDGARDYERVNRTIIREAGRAAKGRVLLSIVVWDGISRGLGDLTGQFKRFAKPVAQQEIVVATL